MKWRWLPAAWCWCVAGLAAQDDLYKEDLASAQENLAKGKLTKAHDQFDEILEAARTEPEADRPDERTVRAAREGVFTIDLMRGQYAPVQKAIEALPPAEREQRALRVLLARALAPQGRYEDALALMQALPESDAEAQWRQGDLLAELGRHDEAKKVWSAAATRAASTPPGDALAQTYAGRCHLSLGGRADLEAASRYAAAAHRAAPQLAEPLVLYAELNFLAFGEAAGFPSGESHYKKVLEQNGDREEALLGLYRLRRSNFMLDPGKTEEYLNRALSLNPRCVPALMERASLILDDRRFEDGARELDEALRINPRDKRVLAHRAAAAHLQNRPDEEAELRKRALAIDPRAEVDRVLGDHLVALYRFRDAVPSFEAALKVNPDDVPTMHGLAKALIYSARGDDAATWLEKAAKLHAGRVDPWRQNALAIQKELAGYAKVDRDGFLMLFHQEDRAVLETYLLPAHVEAMRLLGSKYRYTPKDKVRVEVLHDWDDFSVRTIGFRGFTALGACFGPFLTLVNPGDADLRRQDFMWSATVWHEYAHVLTLALSRQRIPRWFTEGISVYEEKQKNPAWERGMDRELLDAYHNQDIPPLRLLNRLFRGPRILFGYYQGGLVVELLAREHSFAKVLDLVRSYGEDRPQEEAFKEIFGLTTREFDRRFLDWIRDEKLKGLKLIPRVEDVEKLAVEVQRKPDDLEQRVLLGWALLQDDNRIDAAAQLREVLRRAPEHAGGLLLQAELLRRREAMAEARKSYEAGFAKGGDDFDSRIRYARLLLAAGELEAGIDQLQRAKRCWPQCTDQNVAPEVLLANALREAGREDDAMMELKAFCQRTARAYRPRLELAEFEKRSGDRATEAKFLEEAVQIDPFHREVHERLADAYDALGRKEAAVAELRVGLAIGPQVDRAWLGKPKQEVPAPDAEDEREARGRIALRLAELLRELRRDQEAWESLERAEKENPDGDAAAQAKDLRKAWGK